MKKRYLKCLISGFFRFAPRLVLLAQNLLGYQNSQGNSVRALRRQNEEPLRPLSKLVSSKGD